MQATEAARLLLRAKYPLHDAADNLLPAWSVALRAVFASGRKSLPNVNKTVNAVSKTLKLVLPKLLTRGVVAGGKVVALTLKIAEQRNAASKTRLVMQFNASAPNIAKWAKQHAAELVTSISETTRERLNATVTRHMEGLLDDTDFADALRDAVGDVTHVERIARTETMRSVHFGQREAWNQAIDKGLLSGDEKRVWIVTLDDALCDECEPMDGETAPLDGVYVNDIEGPPLHPQCRCTESLS